MSQVLSELIEESAKYVHLKPDLADPRQLFYRFQIATNDQFPQIVIKLERLRNTIMSMKSRRLRRALMPLVFAYIYGIASQSSVKGILVKIMHSKKEELHLVSRDFKDVGNFGRGLLRNKATQKANEQSSIYSYEE